MKRILMSTLIVLSSMVLYSQNLIVEYNLKIDISEKLKEIKNPIVRNMVKKEMGKPIKYELTSSNGISTYKQMEVDNNSDNSNATIKINSNSILYKNQKSQLLIEQREYKSRLFLIKEQLKKYDWEITNEKVKIGDYICTKALLKKDDYQVTAWFAQDIPVNEGPFDYYGLPGLIMKLIDGVGTYEVAKISPTKENLNIKEPTKGRKVTKEEFEKMKERKEKNEEKSKDGVEVIVEEY